MSLPATRAALYELLTGDSGLTGFLPSTDAVYHRTAPQDAVFPFVLLWRQAGSPIYALDGTPVEDELWMVKAVDRADTGVVADAIDERLRELLQDAELTISGQNHLYCRIDSLIDFGESEKGEIIHHVGALYRIYREPA